MRLSTSQRFPLALQDSEAANDEFQVLQPGSSVATALSEGESRPKHVQLLDIVQDKYRLVQLPLTTVRPFVFEQARRRPMVRETCIACSARKL
jgi:hypothetical protein